MLQRDYIVEIVGQFAQAVADAFRGAVRGKREGCEDVERQIGELLELDPETALSLAPDSLVTMMILSGMGDSLASYVCYALDRLARVYDAQGEGDLAELRRLQAQAVAESFSCDANDVPEELQEVDGELFA